MVDKALEFSNKNLISSKDYENAARIALEGKQYENALKYITKAVTIKDRNRPFDTYFKIIESMMDEIGNCEDVIDEESMMAQSLF